MKLPLFFLGLISARNVARDDHGALKCFAKWINAVEECEQLEGAEGGKCFFESMKNMKNCIEDTTLVSSKDALAEKDGRQGEVQVLLKCLVKFLHGMEECETMDEGVDQIKCFGDGFKGMVMCAEDGLGY